MAASGFRAQTKTGNQLIFNSSLDTFPFLPPLSRNFRLSGPIFTLQATAAPQSFAPCFQTTAA